MSDRGYEALHDQRAIIDRRALADRLAGLTLAGKSGEASQPALREALARRPCRNRQAPA